REPPRGRWSGHRGRGRAPDHRRRALAPALDQNLTRKPGHRGPAFASLGLSAMRELFLLDPDVVFLNHGSFGACPRAVFEEYQRFQLELERQPVEFLGRDRRFPGLIESAKARLADYVGADPQNFVFVANATSGVN